MAIYHISVNSDETTY